MIKAIFFDLDGVLTLDADGLLKISMNICSAAPHLPMESVHKCYLKHSIPLLKSGQPHLDIWEDFCSCVGTKIDIDLLPNALRTVRKNEALFKFIESLNKQYTIGIITDNFSERMDLLKVDMELSKYFDPIIVSAEVHASKHDGTTTIYDAALEAANCTPEETLFIDNTQRNLIVPSQMGIHTYWHDDSKNDVDALIQTFGKILKK